MLFMLLVVAENLEGREKRGWERWQISSFFLLSPLLSFLSPIFFLSLVRHRTPLMNSLDSFSFFNPYQVSYTTQGILP
jgi:hypothetical protein